MKAALDTKFKHQYASTIRAGDNFLMLMKLSPEKTVTGSNGTYLSAIPLRQLPRPFVLSLSKDGRGQPQR